ncbi:MAG: hypothetical protein IKN65_00210 [Clostridia bacterium]|nr:hypothetical protein [Bacilli bacterium]MBR3672706.1 hypothetical protein [Clostridia bacterium]MBR4671580.1 hypothetical protein [Bacilli bacterium]
MKINKDYKKFYELENNKYYLLKFDNELHIATENVLRLGGKYIKKELTQSFKLLELTPPLLFLFQELVNCDVDKVDEEFKDMTTYKKIDNLKLRKNIEKNYMDITNGVIDQIRNEFEDWLGEFALNNPNVSDEEFAKIEEINRTRIENEIATIKDQSPINFLDFKYKSGDNLIIKKFLNENFEYLYTQRIGSNYKITYLYDLDIFGTITIYKIHTVKNVVKTIETFIYNREIIQEMLAYIVNHNM